jgi:chromosome segregation ATPase
MEAEAIYEELGKQLESISNRLQAIEEKIDLQRERDHEHELNIQRLEIELKSLSKEFLDSKFSIGALKENTSKDLKGLGDKIRDLEERPDKKKAGIVNTIIDRTFNYIIGIILAAAAAYVAVTLKK